jgi:acetolactate synthase-1/3 small subunit
MSSWAGSSAPPTDEQQVLVLVVRDRGDVLERILGVLRRRAPFFSTVNVAASEEPGVARVTIGFQGTHAAANQAIAHLRKLVDVCWAVAIPASGADKSLLLREFALIRVACDARNRREIVDLAHLFAARAVDIAATSITLEVSGSTDRIENLLRLLQPFGIRELIRTGQVAMRRGSDQQDEERAGREATG